MKIVVEKDLKKINLYAVGAECQNIFGVDEDEFYVTSFDNPVLMTDFSRIAKLEPGLRDSVFSLYMNDNRIVVYDQVESHHSVHAYPRVWSANIDTIWFAKLLKKSLDDFKGSLFECGTGSGFLSQFSLHHNPDISEATATDINPFAIKSLTDNCHDRRLRPLLTDGNNLGISAIPDVTICNPPYIPRPNANTNNPYEGLKLIDMLIQKNLPRLLINVSSTAGDLGLGKPLETFIVPLKVNVVTNAISESSKDWLAWLINNNRVIERDPDEYGYRYWHQLRYYDIQ